jgi:hypothetical protein
MATESTEKKKAAPRKKSAGSDLKALVAQLTARIDQLEEQLAEASRPKPVDRDDVPTVDAEHAAEWPLTEHDVRESLRGEDDPVPDTVSPTSRGSEDEDAPLSDQDIAELFAQADQLVAPKDEKLTASDLQNLLDDGPESAGFTPPSATMMSDQEIANLMQAAAEEQQIADAFVFPDDVRGGETSRSQATSPNTKPRLKVVSRDSEPEPEPDELAAVVPMELAVAALALPIAFAPGKLVCQVAEPFDHEALAAVSHATGRLIETHPTPVSEVVSGLRNLYRQQGGARRKGQLLHAAGTQFSLREWLLGVVGRVA